MKWRFILFFSLIIALFPLFLITKKGKNIDIHVQTSKQSTTSQVSKGAQIQKEIQKSLCVPYWSTTETTQFDSAYSSYYYFGVVPDKEGLLQKNEPGYTNLNLLSLSYKRKTSVVLRMMHTDTYMPYFESKEKQKILAEALRSLVNEEQLQGVMIDLEVSYSLQTDRKDKISGFVQTICSPLQKDKKTCGIFIYGDTFFRMRPYDVAVLGRLADRVTIMAYDFHNSAGEPGPNFPLSINYEEKGQNTGLYGYDFKQMITDFTQNIPKEKLEIALGMYGYDWTLNQQGTPLKAAQAMSVNLINSKMKELLNDSSYRLQIFENRDKEKRVEYIDKEGRKHIIWYEDIESARQKMEYAQDKGITQFSFWAHSYF